MERKRWTSIV